MWYDLRGATDTAGISSGLERTAARILAECLARHKALGHSAACAVVDAQAILRLSVGFSGKPVLYFFSEHAGAISFGNHHDFLYGEKIEQEIAEGCRRLMKNAIICWNYLYLSQTIAQEEDLDHRQEMLAAVKNGSVVSWRHVNLHGEYDFSDEKMQDSVGLHLPPALVLSVS